MDEDGPSWGYFPGTLVGNGSCMPNTTYTPGVRNYAYTVYSHKLWYGMLVVSVIILAIYALLSGVILAVCGPEMTWLQLRSITGTPDERKRARIVTRMRRHSSWMLCSLIICTVICAEILPIIIQGLWAEPAHAQWVPILISTLVIALCAEILPQYFIPRNPVEWAYFFWPVIYSCMCLTAIISWPLGWILDNFGGKDDEKGIFTNGELGSLIKYHERSENNGGMLGPDASRVMTGALLLESRQVGGEICSMPDVKCNHENDVEKANMVVFNGMLTRWSSVKTANIDEVVDAAFLSKVKSWSYSRIPVIGTCIIDEQPIGHSSWEGREIFGFLHLKSLVGLEIKDSRKMFVRDLPIYPLPIIQEDMPAYQVLNIFQLGMSRMAIIVPKPLRNGPILTLSANNFDIVNKFQTPCWAPIEQNTSRVINAQVNSKPKSDEETSWATDVLEAAKTGTTGPEISPNSGEENSPQAGNESNAYTKMTSNYPSQKVVGIRCPKPVGMVTFEDIVGVILQRPNRVSIDFYNGGTISKPAKPLPLTKRQGQDTTGVDRKATPAFSKLHAAKAIPLYVRNNSVQKRSVSSHLRKRNVSNKGKLAHAMDGADEVSFELSPLEPRPCEVSISGRSSYTQNSCGGFHDSAASRLGRLPIMGLDGADECIPDTINKRRHVALNPRNTDGEHDSDMNNFGADFNESGPSEETAYDAMDLTKQLLFELRDGKHSEDFINGVPRSCSLPSRTALAISHSAGPRIPWARRYVSIAAPKIGVIKRESFSSLERIAGAPQRKYKLNPNAPVFRVTSATDRDHSVDQNNAYSADSFLVGRVDGRAISSSAPSIGSSFHRQTSWLYDASKLTSEARSMGESEILDWNAIRKLSGLFDHPTATEPYNGDPNSCLFDGPIFTPAPSEGIPAELLNNMAKRKGQLIHHKSDTLPYIRGMYMGKECREESLSTDIKATIRLEGEHNAASAEQSITTPHGGVRRSSFWF